MLTPLRPTNPITLPLRWRPVRECRRSPSPHPTNRTSSILLSPAPRVLSSTATVVFVLERPTVPVKSGKITGNFKLRLGIVTTTQGITSGAGILTISNPNNDWGGNTIIQEGTLKLGASDVIPNGASAGNVIFENDQPAHTNTTTSTI